MSRFLSKLLSDKPNPEKDLPQGFAEQILQYDITFVLSNFTNLEALNHLVQLYMKGVEYYESIQDRKQEYFKYKLQWLMSHPNLLQEKNKKVELHYPEIKTQLHEPKEKAQVQLLMNNLHQDERIITKIIQNEIKDQEQRINSRLRQRSTSKNERDIQAKQHYNYNMFVQQQQIREVQAEEEQSYVFSKHISPHK